MRPSSATVSAPADTAFVVDPALLADIDTFLLCPTPEGWLANAVDNLETLLIDHANCEKKAASTALSLIYRYSDDFELLNKMSRLAREELRHFEQVIALMKKRGIAYQNISAADYAAALRKQVASWEPLRLVDTLIASALIEARSCERFARLAPLLDPDLGAFYHSLLKSEARHFKDYLGLARKAATRADKVPNIEARIEQFRQREAELIQEPAAEFRFHSGPLVDGARA